MNVSPFRGLTVTALLALFLAGLTGCARTATGPAATTSGATGAAASAAASVRVSPSSGPASSPPPAPTSVPRTPEPTAQRTEVAVTPQASGRLLLAYYFYWYDSRTGTHLEPGSLRQNFPAGRPPSWKSVDWHRGELTDMAYAGIDVALPVYWGFDRPQDPWSSQGLDVLAEAGRAMARAGEKAPKIGLFLDTTIVGMRDLTSVSGKQWFYANYRDFFTRIPREQWALVDGRPIVFLFTSDFTAAVDQSTFDYVYERFQIDFGVRPYIVREVSWDFPILRWERGTRVRDMARPIRTENSYLWAAAIHGYIDRGGVAAIGPGYDERGIPGRSGTFTDREAGQFYRRNFDAAIRSGKRLLVIETWNEMHEASGIADSLEFGRTYLELTRTLAAQFHSRP